MNRSPPRSDGRSQTARQDPASASHPPKTNTVLRALRLLRDEGLLEFRRGHGISVTGTPERGAVITRARELVGYARLHGYRLDELVKIIEDIG